MSPEEFLRLFVAWELPAAMLEALGQIQESLRRAGAPRLRWVRPEGIHLTLKFLGQVPQSRVAAIVEALRGAAALVRPFNLSLARPGTFGGRQRPRVVWVGLAGDIEPLLELQAAVEKTLAGLGFRPEERPFSPHLTLARVPKELTSEDRRRLVELVQALEVLPSAPSLVQEISLMRSILGPGGAVYRQLAVVPLGV